METFDWNDFLNLNNSTSVPEEIFVHVQSSINNGIKQGMLLEVCHKNNPDIYWIAEINMVCGHLLRIKFIGANNDFWCDVSNTKVHPLGWCGKYDELIEPPDEINTKYGDRIIDMMRDALINGVSVTIEALNNKGLSPIDRIKPGMKVEVQNLTDPYRYWIATISENVGGRLLLQYDGGDDLNKFWIFFSNPRLSCFGYVTNKGSPWQFKYPGKVNKFSCKNKLSSQLRLSAEEAIKDPAPADLFLPNPSMEVHNFVTGMKLEALDPATMKWFKPATIAKVFNNYHFLVVLDDSLQDYEDSKMAWLCDSLHPYIFPINYAQKNSLPFKYPEKWTETYFDWDEYLTLTGSVPAPDYCFGKKEPASNISVDMKLEAVNPEATEEIHVANVSRVVEHLLCIELLPIRELIWTSHTSDLLFPVGWCDSYNYELHIPDPKAQEPETKEPAKPERKPTEEWCERIFFNYKCYSGPMISKNKLSQLPKHVGPGPLTLVLKEVLNKMISASYKPAKLLKDWETEGPPEEGMRLEMLKAKLKTSTYHAYVPIATCREQVHTFCKSFCTKLQACPCLFGPLEFPEQCPQNCQQVDKSKFQNNSVERRGRPKGSVSGKKKKRKTTERPKEQPQGTEPKEIAESANESERSGSTPPSETNTRPNSPDSDCKRPKRHRETKSQKMKTRGAKLPNFAQQIKEAHWTRKDVETIYTKSYTKKGSFTHSDSEADTRSTNSNHKNISDVSDSEEPELKQLKYTPSHEPEHSDNKTFEKNISMSWNGRKLSSNPLDWSIDDVHAYLYTTDCKLIADKMREEEIDGEALIMLDLQALTEFLHMKKEFALQLCKHIAKIKWSLYSQF